MNPDLMTIDYRTVSGVSGPLLFVEGVSGIGYGETVAVTLPDGEVRNGQVLDISEGTAIVQVFEGTNSTDTEFTKIRFTGRPPEIDVSIDMLGRVFTGMGKPRDNGPCIIPESRVSLSGNPINPYSRSTPEDFIETGISAIDALNTLVRGQKLPIFAGAGLPAATCPCRWRACR